MVERLLAVALLAVVFVYLASAWSLPMGTTCAACRFASAGSVSKR